MSESNNNCKEYQALQYKTMINNGTNIDTKIVNETNEDKINNFLENEIAKNKKQPWIKLTRTNKVQKLKQYLKDIATPEYNLTQDELVQSEYYLIQCLERKKLHKNNEVLYNDENGLLEGLQSVLFDTEKRKFLTNKNFNSSLKNKSDNKKPAQRSKTQKKPKKNQ